MGEQGKKGEKKVKNRVKRAGTSYKTNADVKKMSGN
jgi:hypothetical protein